VFKKGWKMLPVNRLEDLNRLQNVEDAKLISYIKASLAGLENGVTGDLAPGTANHSFELLFFFFLSLFSFFFFLDVNRIVTVLSYLFSEAAKLGCSETDFKDSLVSFPLGESTKNLLCSAYLSSVERIRSRLEDTSADVPHYADLDWRVDVELASRSLRSQTVPTWMMKLSVKDGNGKVQEEIVQTDAVNLNHLYEELSMAFAEERTGYAKRIQRNIK
jgi:hypothetical protein